METVSGIGTPLGDPVLTSHVSVAVFFFYLYLAASGVSCGMWDLLCIMWGLLLWCTDSLVVLGLSGPAGCGVLVPGSGIEPQSPALEGGFLTAGPPGKSLCCRLAQGGWAGWFPGQSMEPFYLRTPVQMSAHPPPFPFLFFMRLSPCDFFFFCFTLFNPFSCHSFSCLSF